MPTKATEETLTVLESFVGQVDGEERIFRAGDLVRPNDPAVKKWPQFFGLSTLNEPSRIERATAGPGEKRG